MISYEPFYTTMRERSISTYKLVNQYGSGGSLLDRSKHNKPISTVTLDDLGRILNRKVEEVLFYTPEV